MIKLNTAHRVEKSGLQRFRMSLIAFPNTQISKTELCKSCYQLSPIRVLVTEATQMHNL